MTRFWFPRFAQSVCCSGIKRALIILAIACGIICPVIAQTSGKVIKWDQPPVLAAPANVFYGWNQESVYNFQVAADDWACTTTNPVTKIRWWGSFIGWQSSDARPVLPFDFRIHFWKDQPAGPGDPFSHPLETVWQILCTNFTWQCVGQDYDPRTGSFETCFLFEQTLQRQEWFYQDPLAGTNIYWISIAADYPAGLPATNRFGWKTRVHSADSPAPDAAVVIQNPNNPVWPPSIAYVNGFPITWTAADLSKWDLAFELITSSTSGTSGNDKWEQLPDLTANGIDVNVTYDGQVTTQPPYVLADDFLCTSPGPITNIVIWGSWLNDILPKNDAGAPDPSFVRFVLSLHTDYPGPGYSHPSNLVWYAIFPPGTFTHTVYKMNIQEGWLNPPGGYLFPGDTVCHQYEFNLPAPGYEPFFQQGTATSPQVYWLDVQAQIVGAQPEPRPTFGWKTSITNWNDAAVWANVAEPASPPGSVWNPLFYLPPIPSGASTNLAFRINTGPAVTVESVKWSQPPTVATNAGNWYNGWNEPSIDGPAIWNNTLLTNIVADDWLCTNARPVTDIHWWGSFLNWTGTNLPPQLPVAYHFAIWTDVPTNANNPFSHPEKVTWDYIASTTDSNLKARWVGWDLDPRTPCLAPESCFKFDYPLPNASWFFQPNGTNTFWLSISAVYPTGIALEYPFGWKTRPHVPVPPDDAVRIFEPLVPSPGIRYVSGQPIEFPAGTSWDMAFRLASCQQAPSTNVVFTGITVTNVGAQQVITVQWNAQPGSVYQVQEASDLNHPPPIVWTDVGALVFGPANSITVTNPASYLRRFYRIYLPDICP
jgi:hypothetical protein